MEARSIEDSFATRYSANAHFSPGVEGRPRVGAAKKSNRSSLESFPSFVSRAAERRDSAGEAAVE